MVQLLRILGRIKLKANLPHASCDVSVPFYDIDSLEVVWHGHYAKYLERARCALLEKFNYSYPQMRESGYAWPVVKLSLKYVRSAVYGQELRVVAHMLEWEYRLVIEYHVLDRQTGKCLTTASSTQMAIDVATGETCFGTPSVLEVRLREAGYL